MTYDVRRIYLTDTVKQYWLPGTPSKGLRYRKQTEMRIQICSHQVLSPI